MKKLALLLAALSVASVSYAKEVAPAADVVIVEEEVMMASAAPMFAVTSVGQWIEFDNVAGSGDGNVGAAYLAADVNAAYGDDWKFGLTSFKTWNNVNDFSSFDGNSGRSQLTATRVYDGFTVGTRWRGQDSYDRFYLMGSYATDMVSGNGYIGYTATASGADYWYGEFTPVSLAAGPVNVAWYVEAKEFVGSTLAEGFVQNQIRVSGNYYEGEKLTLGAQVRYGIYSGDGASYDNEMAFMATAGYAVTENLSLDAYYLYEIREIEPKPAKPANENEYYGETWMGWTYSF